MQKVLLVIAGLVPDQQGVMANVDAITGASKNVNARLYAYTTSGIAYKIKGWLEENGCAVDVVSAESVRVDLSRYGLIIVGSGVYGMSPHSSVKAFIQSNEPVLKTKRVALFAVSGTMCTDSEKHRLKAMRFADQMVFGLSPVSKTVFRGRVAESGPFLNWVGKQLFKSLPPGDYRDWALIKEWSLALVAQP